VDVVTAMAISDGLIGENKISRMRLSCLLFDSVGWWRLLVALAGTPPPRTPTRRHAHAVLQDLDKSETLLVSGNPLTLPCLFCPPGSASMRRIGRL